MILLGDESGYELGDVQKLNSLRSKPNGILILLLLRLLCLVYQTMKKMRTDYAVKIPYALGLIATRSTTKEVTGLKDLMQQHEVRIRNGMLAYAELEKLRAGDRSPELLASFEKIKRFRLWPTS